MVRHYAAKTYPGKITLFQAIGPASNRPADKDPTMGWGALAQGGVEVHSIQANHVALLVKPYVQILAQELRSCFDRES